MRIDRCVKSNPEVVNKEMFIKMPPPHLSMSGPQGRTSCWVPREILEEVKQYREHAGDDAVIFFIVDFGHTKVIYMAEEMIVFSGGDILALVSPVGIPSTRMASAQGSTIQ